MYSGKSSDCDMLRACYRNSLDLAKKADLHSIIFPAISTGAFGFPAKIAAEIAYDTIAEWQKENSKYKMQVALCAYDDRMYQLYKQVAA